MKKIILLINLSWLAVAQGPLFDKHLTGQSAPAIPSRPVGDPDRFVPLIRQLNDAKFVNRQDAERQLLAQGSPAVFAIRSALDHPASLDQRRMLESILRRIEAKPEPLRKLFYEWLVAGMKADPRLKGMCNKIQALENELSRSDAELAKAEKNWKAVVDQIDALVPKDEKGVAALDKITPDLKSKLIKLSDPLAKTYLARLELQMAKAAKLWGMQKVSCEAATPYRVMDAKLPLNPRDDQMGYCIFIEAKTGQTHLLINWPADSFQLSTVSRPDEKSLKEFLAKLPPNSAAPEFASPRTLRVRELVLNGLKASAVYQIPGRAEPLYSLKQAREFADKFPDIQLTTSVRFSRSEKQCYLAADYNNQSFANGSDYAFDDYLLEALKLSKSKPDTQAAAEAFTQESSRDELLKLFLLQ